MFRRWALIQPNQMSHFEFCKDQAFGAVTASSRVVEIDSFKLVLRQNQFVVPRVPVYPLRLYESEILPLRHRSSGGRI